jgi:uncharacterized membrane protein
MTASVVGVVGAVGLILVVVYLAIIILSIAAWVKIISKAGYSGWWVLIALAPLVNVIMFFVFAFSSWPALKSSSVSSDPAWPSSPSHLNQR